MTVELLPVDGVGEVAAGDDLADLLLAALARPGQPGVRDGDVLVLTSKVVSKAEGRGSTDAKDDVVDRDTDRVVAVRGGTRIVRTHHGLVVAGAGVDASNVPAGQVLSLPLDPDASAAGLREGVHRAAGVNVAVVISDTAGRAWRHGQTDLAIGAAGLLVLDDLAGHDDGYGNTLAVTAPAVADELAAAADLVKGKLARRPLAVVRGLAGRVLPPGEHGPGARALVRPEEQDMFGLGAREAVLAAAGAERVALRGLGAPAAASLVAARLAALPLPDRAPTVTARVHAGPPVRVEVAVPGGHDARLLGRVEERLRVAAYGLGWLPARGPDGSGSWFEAGR